MKYMLCSVQLIVKGENQPVLFSVDFYTNRSWQFIPAHYCKACVTLLLCKVQNSGRSYL